jgi:hypothetical protein
MQRQLTLLSRGSLAALLLALAALVAVLAAGASAHPPNARTLRVTPVLDGVVVSSDGRIQCGTRCVATYRTGTVLTLVARANR